MAALSRDDAPSATNPSLILLVIILGIALSIGIVAAGEWALAALVGAFLFVVFARQPVLGLYLTTILLLVSGITIPLGGGQLALPQSAAKLCGVAAIGAWVVHTLSTGKGFRFGWEIWAIIAFAGWTLVGISMSLIWRIQMPEWTRLMTVIGYFILAVNVLDTKEKLHKFIMIIVACATAMASYAILQFALPSLQFTGVAGIEGIGAGADYAFVDPEGTASGAAVRVTGGTGHSNWLAFTMLMVLPLNVYWYATRKSNSGRFFVALVSLIECAALVLTFTRLGLLVGVIVGLILLARSTVRLTPHRVSAVALALLLAWFVLPGAYKERVIDFTSYSRSESTSARVELQQYAWTYMQQYPIVGIGLAGYGPRFYDENTDTSSMLRWMVRYLGWNPIYYGPHNLYLQLGSETGTVGLLIMLFFILRALLNAQRAEHAFREKGDKQFTLLAATVTVSLLAFVFCGLFLHVLQQKIWWMVFAAAVALPYCATQLADSPEQSTNDQS
ncbi:MAG TPA: O-antigen ligase family protein [Candidatus Hydrogenedentes bacterium]|nr:O-antigen ligase family protein [Candidatus Hydrogenedentota bacterium]HRK33090.1 O-antigen ligase family protein [Candidatus Hydrogenedentota bacterium]